jgi:hypothetical protein
MDDPPTPPTLQTHQFASTTAAARWRGTTAVVVVLLAGPVVLGVLAHVRLRGRWSGPHPGSLHS